VVHKSEAKFVVSVRLTPEQAERIDRIVKKSRKETGFDVNRSDVIRKLVDVGLARVDR